MSTHNTTFADEATPTFNGFRDIHESRISPKSRTIDYYLYLIEPYFECFEVCSTEGERRTPYPFQWFAKAKPFLGDDDGYEGKGGSPLEAIRNLYLTMSQSLEQP